ncbi:hypothetical protein LIER_01140 [Lithospermum erythrorhizon]|uniref:Retrovirus-related Pol polyprotein from transposon TNT 1-94-like beta-barrel domain-containing protein n=1 Tax=Lithospermum erythrorhizon TaxID=34254 RepID=A0AAV3NJT5_LITER
MESFLRGQRLYGYVDGTIQYPPSHLSTPNALANPSFTSQMCLQDQLIGLKQNNLSISAYLKHAKVTYDVLAAIGKEPPQDVFLIYILRGSREDYKDLKFSMVSRGSNFTFEELHNYLLTHEFVNTDPIPPPSHGLLPTPPPSVAVRCSQPQAHLATPLIQPSTPTPSLYSSSPASHYSPWLPDTGATHHISPDIAVFHHPEPYFGSDRLQVANGQQLPIWHTCTILLPHTTRPLFLKNGLHVSASKNPLLSVQNFCKDNNTFFEFHPSYFFIKDQTTRRPLLSGTSRNGLSYFSPGQEASSPRAHSSSVLSHVSPSIWHHRKLASHIESRVLIPMNKWVESSDAIVTLLTWVSRSLLTRL